MARLGPGSALPWSALAADAHVAREIPARVGAARAGAPVVSRDDAGL